MLFPADLMPIKLYPRSTPIGVARARRPLLDLALRLVASALICVVLAAVAKAAERRALWRVVQSCVADYKLTGFAFPCLDADLSAGEEQGWVILKPPFGIPDTILAPTRKIVGIEDPWLQTSGAPNYFQAAWNARAFVVGEGGNAVEREEVALGVNSRFSRSQDQLHIHMGCLVGSARNQLQALAPTLPIGDWKRVETFFPRFEFWALRTGVEALTDIAPFRLAAERLSGATLDRARLMIVVTRTKVFDHDEFLVLASRAAVDGRRAANAEEFVTPCSKRANTPNPGS